MWSFCAIQTQISLHKLESCTGEDIKQNEFYWRLGDHWFKLSVCISSLCSHQDHIQAMVDSNSHSETDGFPGNHRPFLQVHPWKHHRDFQHEERDYEQANEVIT